MPRIEIVDDKIQKMSGNAARSGKPYTMHMQSAYLFTPGAPHPDKFEIILPKDDSGNVVPPFKPGFYTIDVDASLKVTGGRLSLSPVLLPEAAPKKNAG